MKNEGNVIPFAAKKPSNKRNTDNEMPKGFDISVKYPSMQEVKCLNLIVKSLQEKNPGQMIPVDMWNGEIYKKFLDDMTEYAEKIGASPWDVFALLIDKIHGLNIDINPNGSVSVICNPQP